MHTGTRSSRRVTAALLKLIEIVIVGVVPVLTVFRLGNMQLDGVVAAFAGGLALLAAMTSLLFNRARAYPAGKTQRRTLLAAELLLRATIVAAFGAIISALIFPYLASSGYAPVTGEMMPTQTVPVMVAFIVAGFFLRAAFILIYAGRVIGPSLMAPLRARDLARAARGEGR
jgi:hypothetical protein